MGLTSATSSLKIEGSGNDVCCFLVPITYLILISTVVSSSSLEY